MGAWGIGIFENDIALDLLGELAGDLAGGGAMDRVVASLWLPSSGYIDDEVGSRVLAAAAMLAAANDGRMDTLPKSAAEAAARLPHPPAADVVALARAAASRVLQSSETRDLHSELPPEEFLSWVNTVEGMLNRLR